MRLSRRSLLKGVVPLAAARFLPLRATSAEAVDRAEPKQPLGLVIHSYAVRQADPQRKFADPLAFLEHAHSLGAAGVQTPIGNRDEAYVDALRKRLKERGLYLEGVVSLPRDENDVERFAAEVRTATDCGVGTLRTAMLSGRRYETFDSAAAFRRFADESFARLILARPAVERYGARLAIENHKDWRVPELVDILRRADCPRFGVCVDTGNSMALLEEPHEVVEQLSPFAITTHLKDMDIREYEDGFLLSEVPLGAGLLDIPRIVRTLRDEHPDIRLNLEMMTRDPLKVPCLTPKYWATSESLSGRHLAQLLKLARQRAGREPLPVLSKLSKDRQISEEDKNIELCLEFARKHLAATSG